MNMGLAFLLSVSEMLSWDQQRPLSGTVGSFPNKLREQDRSLPMRLVNPCGVKGW